MNLNPILNQEYQPQLFDLSQAADRAEVETLQEQGLIEEIVDALPEAIEDLFKVTFPFIAPGSPEYQATMDRYVQRHWAEPLEEKGVWVYYPWRHALVHLPSENDYFKLRTARNKFLIEPEEQDKFYHSKIGVAGLSVGSSVVNAMVLSGGAGHLRIADYDTLAVTNLNRLSASAADLTRPKAIISARRVYELNPFQDLRVYEDGFKATMADDFFGQGKDKLDLFIEEMDSINLKIESRFMARERQIPVVMATDNGDNTIIDVERFDLEPDRPLFHGSVPEAELQNIPENPPIAIKVKLANSIVGPDVTPRMQYSLTMVGSRVPSWPQLGNAAILSGAAVSYVARRILTGESMPSGRYHVNFDRDIDPDYHASAAEKDRAQKKTDFIDGFNLIFGGK